MYEWMNDKPVRFMSVAWFLSFIIGWLIVLLIDIILRTIFKIDSANESLSFTISLFLFGFTIAGFISGSATANLVRIHKGEMNQVSYNLIVLAWTVAITLAGMFFFLIVTLLVQPINIG